VQARAGEDEARATAGQTGERSYAGSVEAFHGRQKQALVGRIDHDGPARPEFGDRPFGRKLVARHAAQQSLDTHP